MEQIVLVVHLLTALAIIGLILLQQGKGAEMGASFGAGASQTLFGSDGSGNVLTRATAWLVLVFFVTSFGLAIIANQRSGITDDLGLDIPQTQSSAVVEELPAVQDELPAVKDELPAASGSTPPAEELPSLD